MTNKDRLRKLLARQLYVGEQEITDATKLYEDLQVDSLDVIECVMLVEDRFGVSVPDTTFEDWMTITFGEASSLLETLLSQ